MGISYRMIKKILNIMSGGEITLVYYSFSFFKMGIINTYIPNYSAKVKTEITNNLYLGNTMI